MTCIVGLVDEGKVYIGADSAGVAGFSLTIRKDAKVFRNGDVLIGGTSSFRMLQLLRYAFVPPTYESVDGLISLERYMATEFVDAIRHCFKDGGFAQKTSEQESGGKFLVGFAGRLFCIDSDYQVGESMSGYDAIGCGDDVALGALYATADILPVMRIEFALRAAEHHNTGVRGPFRVECLEGVAP